jgi:hypothetical protein
MANIEFGNDPNYSIRINFGRSLPNEFRPIITWFAEQLYTPNELRQRYEVKIRTINCILANLAYAARIDPELHVGSPFSPNAFTQTRYNVGDIGYRSFVVIVRRMRNHELPFVTYHRGFDYPHIGRVGRIRATDRTLRILFGFAAHVRENIRDNAVANVDDLIDEFVTTPVNEVIGGFRQETILEQAGDIIVLRDADGVDIRYEDNDETNALRNRLNQWNEFLASNFHVDLLLTDDEILEVFSELQDRREVEEFYGDLGDPPSVVELTKTRLRRIFNHSRFDRGGRFYGGWWQTIPSRFRRRITVNCVPTIEVDYSTLHPAMLYAEEGLHLPGDAYAIDGIDPRHRKLIKKTLLRLINATADQNIERPREHALPEGWTWQDVQQALIEKHQPIARHLRSGAGLRLMRKDSDIAAQVMRNMHLRNLPVLPVHDSFLTYAGSGGVLAGEMLDSYEETTGFEVGVARELFIENIFPDQDDEEPLHHAEQIDIALQDPAYAGYRDRWGTFVRSRPAEWRERLGRGLEALDGL